MARDEMRLPAEDDFASHAGQSTQALHHRFGDAESAAVYARAKQLVVDYKVLRLYQKEHHRPGYVSIVICNTWRIDRALDSARVELFERDFLTGEWAPGNTFRNWPYMRLLPLPGRYNDMDPSESAWREVLTKALYRILDAAGIDRLTDGGSPDSEGDKRGPLPKGLVVKIFMDFYLMRNAGASRKRKVGRRTSLRLEPSRFAQALRALRKNIWIEIIDREVLSAVARVKGFDSSILLIDYLRCARYSDDLLRVDREARNLLPLLERIRPEQWHRQDLFARRLWVKDGRKSTALDKPVFGERIEVSDGYGRRKKVLRLQSLQSPATHRWLMRASATVVGAWRGWMDTTVLENVVAANLPARVPAIVLRMYFTEARRRLNDAVRPEYQRAYRLFALRCCEVWKQEGWKRFRLEQFRELRRQFLLVADWMVADGIARGLPDKNATWASICRHSDEWHERIYQAQRAERDARYALKWVSLLEGQEIDGYSVTPLTTSQALSREGREMHHCVGDYDGDCAEGYFRIFSVTDPSGARSTLCIQHTSDGRWTVQQMYGVCNELVPPETEKIGKKVAKLYSQLAREQQADQ